MDFHFVSNQGYLISIKSMTSLEIMVFNRYALMNFRTRRCFILLLLMWVLMESSFEAIRREWSKNKKNKANKIE